MAHRTKEVRMIKTGSDLKNMYKSYLLHFRNQAHLYNRNFGSTLILQILSNLNQWIISIYNIHVIVLFWWYKCSFTTDLSTFWDLKKDLLRSFKTCRMFPDLMLQTLLDNFRNYLISLIHHISDFQYICACETCVLTKFYSGIFLSVNFSNVN